MEKTSRPVQRPSGSRDERGIILAVTLLVMLLLTALGSALLTLSSAEIVQGRLSQNRLQAFNLAEAGEAYARRALSLNLDLDGAATGNVPDATQVFDDNVPVTWNSSGVLDSLQKGATGKVTIARHTGDTKLAVITSEAKFGYATKTVEVIVRRAVSIPPWVKGAVTARWSVDTNGSLTIDGRDHTINGNLILNNGTYGVYTEHSFVQAGSSKVGGTDAAKVDHQPQKPGDPSVIVEYAPAGSLPTTPDAVMGGPDNGYPEGALKTAAQSGMPIGQVTCPPGPSTAPYCYDAATGNQYAQNPADLQMPMKGVTYVELAPGAVWDMANLGDSTGILIVHNSATNAAIKNLTSSGQSCGCFRGLVIADDIVHIHSTITGAVVSLTTGPSEGNVIGNGNGKVLFSRAALEAAGAPVQKIWPIYSWREVK